MTHRDLFAKAPRLVRSLLLATAVLAPWPALAHSGSGHPMPMTDAAMKARADEYWATHKPVGEPSKAAAVIVITGRNFQFDSDGNLATVVDTASIHVGDTVQWSWVNGFHTVTSGIDSGDPNYGQLFDAPLDNTHTTFSFQFNNAGIFPYFCIVHEGAMSGVVRVTALAGTGPPVAALGFTRDPYPNPTRAGVSFSFALSEGGHARVEVFDAGGRRVALPLDRDLGVGPHDGTWDGRRANGTAAGAGIYYLRLSLPGYLESRRITLAR